MNTELKVNSRSAKSAKNIHPMGKLRFLRTDWKTGNKVRLTNGKVYNVIALDIPHNSLLLHSDEFDCDFIADCRIINKRTSK